VQLLRCEQTVRGDAHAFDELVRSAAQRIALDLLRLARRDLDDLDVEDVVVAESADRPRHDELDRELLADRLQALLFAGAVLEVAGDDALDIAQAWLRNSVEAVELAAEQRLEALHDLGLDTECVEAPDRDLLVEQVFRRRCTGSLRMRRSACQRERSEHERGDPSHDVAILSSPLAAARVASAPC
jgi:hypothetical protein